MSRCPKPYCDGVLFREQTEDGLEVYCMSGHRFSAAPLTPLTIPAKELADPRPQRQPRMAERKRVRRVREDAHK